VCEHQRVTRKGVRSRNKPATDIALSWVKPAHQERSRDTHQRIVAAAERLLERGRAWADITVAELVEEADASIGAFYNRFRDKDTLLHVLQIELNTQGAATLQRAKAVSSPDVPIAVLVRAFVTVAVTSYREQRGLRRALLIEMHGKPEYRARATELSTLTCASLVDVLSHHVKGRDHGRLRDVVDVCHRMVYGLLDQEILYEGAPAGHALTDGKLIDELSTACLAYIAARLPLRS
jgi:AcrR family transcriptional regulator